MRVHRKHFYTKRMMACPHLQHNTMPPRHQRSVLMWHHSDLQHLIAGGVNVIIYTVNCLFMSILSDFLLKTKFYILVRVTVGVINHHGFPSSPRTSVRLWKRIVDRLEVWVNLWSSSIYSYCAIILFLIPRFSFHSNCGNLCSFSRTLCGESRIMIYYSHY